MEKCAVEQSLLPHSGQEGGGRREGGRQILDKTNFSKCLLQPRPRLLISYSGMNSPVGGATDEVRVLMSQSSLSTAALVSEPFITREPLGTRDPNDDTPFSFSTVGLHCTCLRSPRWGGGGARVQRR